MKCIKILIIGFILFIGQNINSQNYFPDSNAVWSICEEEYYVDGDSILNNITYKKYYQSKDSIVSFYSLLREDTMSREIFYIQANSTIEYRLYDFSLSIGDTVSTYPIDGYENPSIAEIIDSDSILIGDDYRLRLKIKGYNQDMLLEEYWIEGIGSTKGLFSGGISAGVLLFGKYYPSLLCYKENDVLLYESEYNIDCSEYCLGVGITQVMFDTNVEIYPNPFVDNINIESENIITKIKLFDKCGKTILEKRGYEDLMHVDLSNIPIGIYILKIETAEGILSKKIIKHL